MPSLAAPIVAALLLAAPPPPSVPGAPSAPSPDEAVMRGVAELLAMQAVGSPALKDFESPHEWPYEGVYRVGGEIPIGYRVGGTAIAALALLAAPGFAEDPPRRDAVERAVRFVAASTDHPLMASDYDGGYDTRGWGHIYGLRLLLSVEALPELAEELRTVARNGAAVFAESLARTEIPEVGGWNYARPGGGMRPCPVSPFMTAPAIDALREAKRLGHAVDDGLIDRALTAIEGCRTPSGSITYAGRREGPSDATPGASGRMLAVESTLLRAGRGDVAKLRGAMDAFIAHWARLEERRARPGTHAPPFGVAPYYFYFAHWQAGEAIGLLPEAERPEYRRRLVELLFRTRDERGRWNDRVFERSAAYGTACAILALTASAGAGELVEARPPGERRRRRGAPTEPAPTATPADGSHGDAAARSDALPMGPEHAR